MQKILVPIDFPESSEYALNIAQEIAQKEAVVVMLLHIIDPERFYTVKEDGTYTNASEDVAYKEHLANHAALKMEDMIVARGIQNVAFRIEVGTISQIVIDYVEKESIDLIVMGSHKHTAYAEMVLGTSIDRIIHAVSCPVITVRDKPESLTFEHIALATKFDETTENVFRQIKIFQGLFKSKLHLVYINTPVSFYNTRHIQELKDEFLRIHSFTDFTFTIYDDFTVETGIMHFAQDIGADVIAVAAHHFDMRNSLTSAYHTSEVLIEQAKRPVMTFNK